MGTSSGFPIAYARCSWARLCAIKTADKIQVARYRKKRDCFPQRRLAIRVARSALAAERWAVGISLGWCACPTFLIGTGEFVLLASVAAISKVGGQDWCWG